MPTIKWRYHSVRNEKATMMTMTTTISNNNWREQETTPVCHPQVAHAKVASALSWAARKLLRQIEAIEPHGSSSFHRSQTDNLYCTGFTACRDSTVPNNLRRNLLRNLGNFSGESPPQIVLFPFAEYQSCSRWRSHPFHIEGGRPRYNIIARYCNLLGINIIILEQQRYNMFCNIFVVCNIYCNI